MSRVIKTVIKLIILSDEEVAPDPACMTLEGISRRQHRLTSTLLVRE